MYLAKLSFSFFLKQADVDLDSGVAQLRDARAADLWIRIFHCTDYPADPGGDDGVGAGWGSSLMGAGFEIDVEGSGARAFTSVLEG